MSSPPHRVVVTTVPFGAGDRTPIHLLEAAGIELVVNPIGRKLKADEVAGVVAGFPVLIAGTEKITAAAMEACPDLRLICRVGIGLDSLDLPAARRLGIEVSYTPDGPSAAVAELTIGLIIDLLRGISPADRSIRGGTWVRNSGRRIALSTIGVVGVGRIGRRVIRHLQGGFAGVRILANDPSPDPTIDGVEWVDKERLYRDSDVVTLHLPLQADTVNLVAQRELALMKPHAVLINTSRGGIVNEGDLANALQTRCIGGAAVDVFCEEPYSGELINAPNAILTCHMGSMTADCRARMEIDATREAIRFLSGEAISSPVPDEEYGNVESSLVAMG